MHGRGLLGICQLFNNKPLRSDHRHLALMLDEVNNSLMDLLITSKDPFTVCVDILPERLLTFWDNKVDILGFLRKEVAFWGSWFLVLHKHSSRK